MRFVTGLVLLSVVAAAFVGCSKDPEDIVVAKIGERTISLATYEKAFLNVDEKFLPPTRDLVGLRQFLETMVNKEVMAIKSDELGYDKDEYVVQGMEAFKKVGLQAGYMKIKVGDKINVTEDDLKECYKNFGRTLQVKQILVDTRPEADDVYEMLTTEGVDFETVCKRYSKGPDAAEGGKVVNALFGTFEPNFQDELFSTPVGGITKPILSRYGYFIIKVVDEAKTKKRSFEEARPDLETLVRNQQQLRLQNAMSDAVREKHGFEFFEDNLVVAFELLPPDRPLTNPPNRSEEIYPILRIAPQDYEKPLVKYRDKTITMKDFSDMYDRSSFFQRPRREHRLGGLKKFFLDIAMNELVEIEMEESGIENEPEVAAMLQRKREQLMVDKLYQDLVDAETNITYRQSQDYYNANMEQFRRSEERRFGIIITGDMTSAQTVHDKLVAGENFNKVRAEYHIEETSRDLDPEFIEKGANADIDEHGFSMTKVGSVSEPFETARGWMVLKYFERHPERILSHAEAQHDINRYLKTIENEKRLNSLLAKWREEIPVAIYEDNLKKADVDERKRAKRGVEFK